MELSFEKPGIVGRSEEESILQAHLDKALEGKGSTVFVSGEAGLGKTRLVSDFLELAKKRGVKIITGRCMAGSLEPLMPIREGLRNSDLHHLIAGKPPPQVISAYLIDVSGMVAAKAERNKTELDDDIFASMLNAVGNFVKDSLSLMNREGQGLNSIGYGDHIILLQKQSSASLACVIKGTQSEFLIQDMRRILEEIGSRLDDWDGSEDNIADIKNKISWLIKSDKYSGKFLVDDPKLKQENLFDNVLMGIQRESQGDPVIIFIDDLHWADKTTLNLLHYLARNTRDNRILIIGTYRPEDILETQSERTHQLKKTMQNMNRESLFDKIKLERLDNEQIEELLQTVFDGDEFEKNFTEMIYKETEGNPFFVLEVIKLLVEESCIRQQENGRWELSIDIKNIDLPSRVYDVIKRRLDRLRDDQLEMLECASIQGEEFRSEVIGIIMAIGRLKLLRNLSDIEKTHKLIHSQKDRYRFDHAKIKDVLYNGMLEDLRIEYHRMVGDTILELYKGSLDQVVNELAYHYHEGEDVRAFKYLLKAANKAKDAYANEEAVTFYGMALEFAGSEQKVSILEDMGDVLSLIGEYDKAIRHFTKASNSAVDDEIKAKMLRKVAEVHVKKGEYDESLEVLAQAKKHITDKKNTEYARHLFAEGTAHTRMGNYTEAMQIFEKAKILFHKNIADQKDVGNALRAIGNTYLSQGQFTEALENYKRSLSVMKNVDDKFGIAAALGNIGILYMSTGELDKALEFYERSHEIRESIGDKQGISFSILNMGGLYSTMGDVDRALELYEQSFELHRKIGDIHGTAMSLLGIGEMHYLRGDVDKALELYQRSLDICLQIGEKRVLIYNYCKLAEVKINQVQTALEYAKKAVAISSEIGAKSQEGLSRCILGQVYREAKEWDDAIKQFQLSGEILKEVDNKYELARYHYEYAILLEKIGLTKESAEHLKKALFLFESLGMKTWAEKCKKLI